jgi:hypothetical protein
MIGEDKHVLHKNADGSEYWMTCDRVEFARIKVAEPSEERLQEFFEEAYTKHLQEAHNLEIKE